VSVEILLNCLRGIAADGTDHPQIDMHRRIAQRAIDDYHFATEGAWRTVPAGGTLVDAAENRVLKP